jgi:hypothetical protein
MQPLLVETDIIVEYLTQEHSTLRQALCREVCYTTFNNALELFAAARTPTEEQAIQQALMSMRLLGLNWRNAKPFADTAHRIEARSGKKLSEREIVIVGMAEMSKLTILTKKHFDRYKDLGVPVINRVVES